MLDSAVALWVVSHRIPALVSFFAHATEIAGDIPVILFFGGALLLSWRSRYAIYARGLVLSLGAAELTSYTLKLLFARARPLEALIEETSYSFPSGHTVVAISLYGYLLWVVSREVKSPAVRLLVQILLMLIILGVGFSRLYLGVHFFSDVVGGYLVGGSWLMLSIFRTRAKLNEQMSSEPSATNLL